MKRSARMILLAGLAAVIAAPIAHADVYRADPMASSNPMATTDPWASSDPMASSNPMATTDPWASRDPMASSNPMATTDPWASSNVYRQSRGAMRHVYRHAPRDVGRRVRPTGFSDGRLGSLR